MTSKNIQDIEIKLDSIKLNGTFFQSPESDKLVIFAHGSGSSRFSPRNISVAKYLSEHKISAFLFDLLTEEEDVFYQNRFDIKVISTRLVEVTRWLKTQRKIKDLKMGYFGASTGAAAALKATLKLPQEIKAVVCRGGRPDLAILDLPKVKAPTLLIVGDLDYEVVDLNKKAYDALGGVKKLEIVNGATHLFEEPGKMEEVSKLATEWFSEYLK